MNDFSPNLSSGFMNAYDPNSMIPRLHVLRNKTNKNNKLLLCVDLYQTTEYLYSSLSSGSEKENRCSTRSYHQILAQTVQRDIKTDLSKEFDEQFLKNNIVF